MHMMPMVLQHTNDQLPNDDYQIEVMRNLQIQWRHVLAPTHPAESLPVEVWTTSGSA